MSSSASDPGRFFNKSKAYAFVDDGKKRGWMINDGGIMRRMDDEEQKEFKIRYKEKYGGGNRDHNRLIKDIMDRRNRTLEQLLGQVMQMQQNRRDQAMQRHKDILKQFGVQGLPGMSIVASSSSSGQYSSTSSPSDQKSISANRWHGWRAGGQRNVNIFVNGKRIAGNGGDFGQQNQNQGGSRNGSGSGSGSQKGTSVASGRGT